MFLRRGVGEAALRAMHEAARAERSSAVGQRRRSLIAGGRTEGDGRRS